MKQRCRVALALSMVAAREFRSRQDWPLRLMSSSSDRTTSKIYPTVMHLAAAPKVARSNLTTPQTCRKGHSKFSFTSIVVRRRMVHHGERY